MPVGHTKRGRESAYPFGQSDGVQPDYGLTKRELFAAMAMQGLLANGNADPTEITKASVICADFLLRHLSDEEKRI